MYLHEANFFCGKGDGPKVSIKIHEKDFYKSTIRINGTGEYFDRPVLTIYAKDLEDLIEFKNSVISEFNKAMRETGYDR